MTYWGGATGSSKCACGMTNSCANPSYGCNCDANDKVWREDSGLLTDKTHLPVRQLRFGDTGGSAKLYHTLKVKVLWNSLTVYFTYFKYYFTKLKTCWTQRKPPKIVQFCCEIKAFIAYRGNYNSNKIFIVCLTMLSLEFRSRRFDFLLLVFIRW